MMTLTAALLSLITVGLHYEALVFISFFVRKVWKSRRVGVALAVTLALGAHITEVGVYSVAWYLLIDAGAVELAHFDMEVFEPTLLDIFYFSGTVYSSLGFGDIVPVRGGHVLAVTESVTGLVLIAWTASYTFFEMQTHWRDVRGGL
ncbi:MAG: two pore domain potassium channel family protein [Acidobacteria bacterium]|nr:two pore domain potassium channel family protein [Acidobacteriota bacterium]